MRALLQWVGVCVGLFGPAAAQAQFMGVYDYPFVSPLAATVAATPPANASPQIPRAEFQHLADVRYVTPFPSRQIPPVFWWLGRGMAYTLFKQPQARAPLFFVIGGTGADHDFGEVVRDGERALPRGLPRRQPAQPDPSQLHRDRVDAPAYRASSSATPRTSTVSWD